MEGRRLPGGQAGRRASHLGGVLLACTLEMQGGSRAAGLTPVNPRWSWGGVGLAQAFVSDHPPDSPHDPRRLGLHASPRTSLQDQQAAAALQRAVRGGKKAAGSVELILLPLLPLSSSSSTSSSTSSSAAGLTLEQQWAGLNWQIQELQKRIELLLLQPLKRPQQAFEQEKKLNDLIDLQKEQERVSLKRQSELTGTIQELERRQLQLKKQLREQNRTIRSKFKVLVTAWQSLGSFSLAQSPDEEEPEQPAGRLDGLPPPPAVFHTPQQKVFLRLIRHSVQEVHDLRQHALEQASLQEKIEQEQQDLSRLIQETKEQEGLVELNLKLAHDFAARVRQASGARKQKQGSSRAFLAPASAAGLQPPDRLAPPLPPSEDARPTEGAPPLQTHLHQWVYYQKTKQAESRLDQIMDHVLDHARSSRPAHFSAKRELAQVAQEEQAFNPLAGTSDGGLFPTLFADSKGKLPLPVRGGQVVSQFGRSFDPQSGLMVFKKGIEIQLPSSHPPSTASPHQSVQAIFKGKVAFAGQLPHYGKVVILDHGGHFFSLSGHLDQISRKLNEQVNVGDLIGLKTDEKTPLYFEIRMRNVAVNPLQWIFN